MVALYEYLCGIRHSGLERPGSHMRSGIRAIRLSSAKNLGTIIIPVFIRDYEDPDEVLKLLAPSTNSARRSG